MIVRQVTNLDRQTVANFVYFERYIHRHLDWKTPLDWVGKQPFFLLEEDRKIAAVLACPPDPPDVVWIRLFVSSAAYDLASTWKMLWQKALEGWESSQVLPSIAAIPLSSWFRNLLESSNFQLVDRVVILICPISTASDNPIKANIQIRAMQVEDLEVVEKVDNAALKKSGKIHSPA